MSKERNVIIKLYKGTELLSESLTTIDPQFGSGSHLEFPIPMEVTALKIEIEKHPEVDDD